MQSSIAELAVVLPTYNERENVVPLVERLDRALTGLRWEAIFVDDDSPDGTAEAVRRLSRGDSRIRCLQRVGRRGLSSACMEGILASSAPIVTVMDADLQHDETCIREMVQLLRDDPELDLVIGSRFVDGGGVESWDPGRQRVSRIAARLSRILVRDDLTDPMSGFFSVRRDAFESAMRRMSGLGFKILVDLLSSAERPLRYREIPYRFGLRESGDSKLDSRVVWDFVRMLLDKTVGRVVPIRFVIFTLVGGLGVGVHLAALVLTRALGASFPVGQSVATLVAITSNYTLENIVTYSDERLRGSEWIRGWWTYTLARGLGAVANVGVAAWVYDRASAGWLLSALLGILVGAFWNLAVTAAYTWKDS